MTLNRLTNEHPEWVDLPIGVLNRDGTISYLGSGATVFVGPGDDGFEPVLLFAI